MVSHPETGSDPPIASDQESGRDTGIPTSEGNPVSCVQAGGNGNMFPALVG